MHNSLVQYLVGTCILSAGLVVLLSAAEIAHGLTHFWERWLGRRTNLPGTLRASTPEPNAQTAQYRTRLSIWRAIGALLVIDGVIWLARATTEVFRVMPHAKP